MPKYFRFMVGNHYLYFTSHCIIEPIHIHASDKKLSESGSAKIWVAENGDTDVESYGNVKAHEMNEICSYIKKNIDVIKKKWHEGGGELNFKGAIFAEETNQ